MKKTMLIALAILLVAAMTAAFVACTPNDDQDLCANGHTWDDGTVTVPATEQSAGTMTYRCKVCGEERTETIPQLQPAHEHAKGTEHAEVPATCTQAGVAQYWDCEANDGVKLNAAGEVVTDAQLAIAALGHTYEVDGALTWKETSSYSTAVLHLVCNVCTDGAGHTLDVELTAKQTPTTASTCGEIDSITYTVSVEDEEIEAAITAAVVAPNKLAPNALEDVAELTHTENDAQLGHQWQLAEEDAFDWTGTTKDGSSVAVKYVCERCSDEITLTFTDATSRSTPATCTAAEQIEYTLTKTTDLVRTAAEAAAESQDVTIYDADTFEAITDQKHTVQGAGANGHTWQVTEVAWAQDYDAETHATVTVKCSVCETAYDGVSQPQVSFTDNTQAATCIQSGSVTYTVTVQVDSKPLTFAAGVKSTSDPYTIPALGHTYEVDGALTWVGEDHSKAKLHLVCNVCQDGAGHTLDVELTAKPIPSSASTCGDIDSITYTVSVEDEDIVKEINKTVGTTNRLAPDALKDVAKLEYKAEETQLGHQWKLAEDGAFSWDAQKESASVTVKYVCEKCSEQITLTFTDAQQSSEDATCTTAQQITYTLTKASEDIRTAAKAAELQDVTIYDTDIFEAINETSEPVEGEPANGHTWQVRAVAWEQDYDTEPHATVTVKCSVCETAYDGVAPEVTFTESSKQEPECEAQGNVTYTVTVKVGGAELGFADEANKTSSVYTIPALGHEGDSEKHHEFQDSTCTAPGTKEYWECKRCDAKLDESDEVIDDVTIAPKNHLYTNKYTNEGCSDGYHKRVCDRCSVAEEAPTACTPDEGDKEHASEHELETGWYANGDEHWQKCSLCGKEYGRERHNYNDYQSDTCLDCGHVHMDVEVSTNDDGSEPYHVDSVKEAFEWIAQQADKSKTYTIRLNHNRVSAEAEDFTVPEGYTVVLDLESYSLTLKGGKLTVTGEETSFEVKGTGTLDAKVVYQSGTLTLPETLLDNLELGESVKCEGESVHITIGDAPLTHKWSASNSFTDDSGHYQVCERCEEHNTPVTHTLKYVSDDETQHHQKCQYCEYTTEPAGHNWTDGEYLFDGADGHYQVCKDCDGHSATVGHDLTGYVSEGPEKHHQECATCDYATTPVKHDFKYAQKAGEEAHDVTCENCDYTGTENCSASLRYDDVCTKCDKDYREEVTIHWHKDESFTNAYLWAWYLNPTSHDVFDSVDNPARLMTADSVGGAGWVSITVKYPRNTERHLKFTDQLYWNDGVTITDCQETSNTSSEKNDIWCSKAGKAFDSKEEALADEKIDPPAKTDWIVVGDNNGWATDTTTWDNAFGMKNGVMQDTVEIKFTANQGFKFKENKSGWSCEQIDCNGAWIVTGAESGTGNLHSLFSSTSDGNIKVLKACTLRFTFDATYKCVKIHVVSVTNAAGTCTYSYGIIGSRNGFTSDWAAGTSLNNGIFTWSNIAFQASETWKIRRGQAWTNSNGYSDVKMVTSNAGLSKFSVTSDTDGNIKMPAASHTADVVFNSFNGHIWINFTK